MYIKFMQKLHAHCSMLMLTKFTNKCNNFRVHINIKFMQKLKHAHAHTCLQNTSVQTRSYLI